MRIVSVVAVLSMLVAAAAAPALDELELRLAGVEGQGWRTGAIRVRLRLGPAGKLAIEASMRRIQLPSPLRRIARIRFSCDDGRLESASISCRDTRVVLDGPEGATLRLRASTEIAAGSIVLVLPRQRALDGHVAGRFELDSDRSRIELSLERVDASGLAGLLAALVPTLDYSVTAGRIDAELSSASWPDHGRRRIAIDASDVAFSNDSGLHAAEELDLSMRANLERLDDAWRGSASVRVSHGALFMDPLLLEFSDAPLELSLSELWMRPGRTLGASFRAEHAPLPPLLGTFELAPTNRLRSLGLELPLTSARTLFSRYVQPFVPASLSALDLEGALALGLDWHRDAPARADLVLSDLSLGDAEGRFALLGVDGTVRWRDRGPGAISVLDVDSAQVGRIGLGETRIEGTLEGRRLRLSPLRVPMLDGALVVDRLEATDLGRDSVRVVVDSALEPVSMGALAQALAWLPLAGTVSGRLPALTYADDAVQVADDIELELFDGDVTVSRLSVRHPLSAVPEVRASIRLDDLSLEQLSYSLSFGRIEGRLEGEIRDLVMHGWRPVAFDAYVGTPSDDRSRHRISQRAVDSLASLGGANAVLSSTFLRFFESFSYERLGLGCRLERGVCEMRGAGPAPRGYYIVKGGGLPPRVNVVGYNRRVDFETLLTRLRALASAGEAVIE